MKTFEHPKMEIISVEANDVIRTSDNVVGEDMPLVRISLD